MRGRLGAGWGGEGNRHAHIHTLHSLHELGASGPEALGKGRRQGPQDPRVCRESLREVERGDAGPTGPRRESAQAE